MSARAKPAAVRNPIYIVYVIFGVILLLFSAHIARLRATDFDSAFVQIISLLPDWLTGFFMVISAVGSLAFVVILALVAIPFRRYKASFKVLIAGIGAYAVSILIHNSSWHANNTFPATSMDIVVALSLVGYQYTPKSRHSLLNGLIALVAVAQIYSGDYLPVDVIGGFAIGLTVGSMVCFGFGRRLIDVVTPKAVRKALVRNDYPVKEVKILNVDARGSSPFMMTDPEGRRYFLKVVNSENFVADWLFKTYRRVIYSRLEDETPFLSPKRQIEHESYVANLAYSNGVRTPRIVGVLEIKPNSWMQIQEAIDGKSVDRLEPAQITDAMLAKIFGLISELHTLHIMHRDLRAANVFLDTRNDPWLIDFGFAEASAKPGQTYRDLVEIICSLGVIVGADRIVKATLKNIPQSEIIGTLPYMQYACLSGETTRLLKLHKELLPQIVEGLRIGTKQEVIKSAKIARFAR